MLANIVHYFRTISSRKAKYFPLPFEYLHYLQICTEPWNQSHLISTLMAGPVFCGFPCSFILFPDFNFFPFSLILHISLSKPLLFSFNSFSIISWTVLLIFSFCKCATSTLTFETLLVINFIFLRSAMLELDERGSCTMDISCMVLLITLSPFLTILASNLRKYRLVKVRNVQGKKVYAVFHPVFSQESPPLSLIHT